MKKNGKDYSRDPRIKREILPTGFHTLDEVLGGGLRSGTTVEFFGEESTGKTYLALNVMAQCQKIWGKPVAYVDYERAWYPDRAEELGVDLDPNLFDLQEPPTQEEGYNWIKDALANDIFGVIVVDSLAAMMPEKEDEDPIQKANVALNARNNSKAMRVLTSQLKSTIVIYINQIRENVGVMFGDSKVTTGGKAIPFYAHIRLDVVKLVREKEEREIWSAKTGKLEKTKVSPGHIMKIKLKKSKVNANQEQQCELVYDYGINGVDRIRDAEAFLFNKGIIGKEGQFYTVQGHDGKIRGAKGLYRFLSENQDLVDSLINEVKE